MEGLEPTSSGRMRKQTFKRVYNWPRANRPDEVSSLFSTSGGLLFLSCLPCSQGDRFSGARRHPPPGDHSEAVVGGLMGSQEGVHWAVETEPPSPLSCASSDDLEGDSRYSVYPWPFPELAVCCVENTFPSCTCWANIFPEKGSQESG